MASFADFVPLRATVTIREQSFDVFGISEADIGQLIFRFPEIETKLKAGKISKDEILELSSKALAAIVAAGTGKLGDINEETGIAALSLGEKAELLSEIWRLTMPGGAGPFVDLVKRLGIKPIAAAAKSQNQKSSDSSASSPNATSPSLEGDLPAPTS